MRDNRIHKFLLKDKTLGINTDVALSDGELKVMVSEFNLKNAGEDNALKNKMLELENRFAQTVKFGTDGELIRNLHIFETERIALAIASEWCDANKLDLSDYVFNVHYRHNANRIILTDKFTVTDICHGTSISAVIKGNKTIVDIIVGDELFCVPDKSRLLNLTHSISEALYATVLLKDVEDGERVKAVKSSNKRHTDEQRDFGDGFFFSDFRQGKDGEVRDGDNGRVNRPLAISDRMVKLFKRIAVKHDYYNVIERPFKLAPEANNEVKPEYVQAHCPECDPDMQRIDKILKSNVKFRKCSRSRKVKGETVTCDNVALVTVEATVKANKSKDKS